MYSISQHKSDFENIYKKLPGMKREWNFQFPLEEIEGFDWHRGKWTNEYYHYFYRRFSSHILSRLFLEDNQKVLVIGCGFGFDEKNIKFLNKTIELWSIDISEEMIKRAIQNQSPSHFLIGVAEKLPFPDHCFDRVLAREVIEHVIEPKAMLQEIGRVLKEGGRAVITTENHRSFAPSHRYDGFIKPKMAKIFQVTLPKSPYKNEAPAMDRTRSEAKGAGLTLLEFFRDGALYKYLPEWAPLLKTSLPRIAHFFSCLENHSALAGVFCDQVKYIFLKEDHSSHRPVPSHEVFLTCPVCKERLDLYPGFYACLTCHGKYYLTGDIPNFLPKEMGEPVDSILPSERRGGKTSFMPKGPGTMFKALNLMCRTLYGFIYIGLAFLATLVVEKNYPYLSQILSKENRFQQYIQIYPRG
jgi:SAM-dependent methyltransferase